MYLYTITCIYTHTHIYIIHSTLFKSESIALVIRLSSNKDEYLKMRKLVRVSFKLLAFLLKETECQHP